MTKQALYTVRDTARQLALSPSTVRRLIAKGEIASVRIGNGERKLRRIPPEAIDAYVRRLKETQTIVPPTRQGAH